MDLLLQLIFNALLAGSLTAIIAVGYTITYTVVKFMNFSYWSLVIVSWYIAAFLMGTLLRTSIPSIIVWSLAGIAVYLLMAFIIFLPLKRKHLSAVSLIAASIWGVILIESILQVSFWLSIQSLRISNPNIHFWVIHTWRIQIIILASALCILGGFILLRKRTKLGVFLRAVAESELLSSLYGLSVRKYHLIAFALSGLLAALWGIGYLLDQWVSVNIGNKILINAFIAASIFNDIKPIYAIAWAFILELVQALCWYFFQASFLKVLLYVLFLLFVAIRYRKAQFTLLNE